MKKWSPALFAGWQGRIVEIKERTLKYYKQKKDEEPVMCGILNFDLYACEVVPTPNEPRQFMVKVLGNEREFFFKAKTAEDAKEWVSVI